MAKLQIGIDIDGILADFNPSYIQLLRGLGAPGDLHGKDPSCWHYEHEIGATKAMVKEAWCHIAATPDWWGRLTPHADMTRQAYEDLLALAETAEVSFITHRPMGSRRATWFWLQEHFLDLQEIPVIVASSTCKAGLFKDLALDYAIDDKPENFTGWDKPEGIVLVRRGWNTHAWSSMPNWGSTGDALRFILGKC